MPLDHYVSQVHLRNFYSPALDNRLMYATRKSDLKSFTPDSSSVCRTLDGSTNPYLQESRIIEEFLRTIEPEYNNALDKLFLERIDHNCIYTIAGFVAYIIGCSPAGTRIASESLGAVVESLAVDAVERGHISLPPEELIGKSLADLLRDRDIAINVTQNTRKRSA